MKRVLPVCALLVLLAGEALACPGCTYERVMPTWALFAAIRLLVVCGLAFSVLDVVRTLEAFLVYELMYVQAWRMAIGYAHPAVSGDLVEWLALGVLLVLSAGVPAAILLRQLGRFAWFVRTPGRGVSWRRALMMVPAFFVIAVVQGLVTRS